jgi:uncharacterized RDD family membrane protein YckC
VEYADHVEIYTPEGVDLELTLGGLGSRFLAELFDYLVKGAMIGALAIVLFAIGGGVSAAIFFVLVFLIWFGYDVLFEVLANGQTPGKRLTGLRVVRTEGQPVGFVTSSIRNLLRLIDGPVTSYVVGIVAIVASSKNQRLGDMAAGTLVVREQPAPAHAKAPPPPAPATSDNWDVSGITQEELAAVRQYLERRFALEPQARHRLAWQLAEGLRPKLAGVPRELQGEALLERIAAAKAARG